jgi:hypothetical protein
MTPGSYHITAPQGATFRLVFTVSIDGVPVDYSTYSARMQVRPSSNSSTKILDLSSTAGDIVLNSSGQISITASSADMSAATPGRHVYDIEVESFGGIVDRILEGKFIVTPEVTQ